MEGTIRILKRFISATMLISIFLLVANFILLGVLVTNGMKQGLSPSVVVRNVAKGLHPSSPHSSSKGPTSPSSQNPSSPSPHDPSTLPEPSTAFILDASAVDLLERNHAWAMLIDETGQVMWNYQLPEEIPRSYSLVDVSKFSRSYLMDYPVFVWEHELGLVVVGYPKTSLAKYQHIFPTGWVSSLPLKIVLWLAANLLLALLLSLFIGSRLIHSIRPIAQGIQSLAEERAVYIEPKGVLSQLAQSVNRVSQILQKKSDRLKSRDEARSNWIAGISHDIRTPLSMILGHASDLEENSVIPEEQRRQAGIIRQQAEKLRSLVSDLNLVSMLEYEMQPLEKKPIRLSALARQVASEFLNEGLEEKYVLEIEALDETALVNGDERLLTRAIRNLIHNSIRHNPDGCRIRLQTTWNEPDRTFRFIVADNGKGVPRDELPNLLKLPYSSKRKHPRKNGHGLGLPMVARIAKAHGGQLCLDSDVGKGFTAELVLPDARS
jgi:signal transduction histidine kinase